MFRFGKDGATGDAPTKVKTFDGSPPKHLRHRAFNVDACWFYWYDRATRSLRRQARSAL